jgi:hypothetical protein
MINYDAVIDDLQARKDLLEKALIAINQLLSEQTIRSLLMEAYDHLPDGCSALKVKIVQAICPAGSVTADDMTWARERLVSSAPEK